MMASAISVLLSVVHIATLTFMVMLVAYSAITFFVLLFGRIPKADQSNNSQTKKGR